jgi:hypothetical protein
LNARARDLVLAEDSAFEAEFISSRHTEDLIRMARSIHPNSIKVWLVVAALIAAAVAVTLLVLYSGGGGGGGGY